MHFATQNVQRWVVVLLLLFACVVSLGLKLQVHHVHGVVSSDPVDFGSSTLADSRPVNKRETLHHHHDHDHGLGGHAHGHSHARSHVHTEQDDAVSDLVNEGVGELAAGYSHSHVVFFGWNLVLFGQTGDGELGDDSSHIGFGLAELTSRLLDVRCPMPPMCVKVNDSDNSSKSVVASLKTAGQPKDQPISPPPQPLPL